MNKLVKVKRYGVKVWCNEAMDNLRREQCMCLNCGKSQFCNRAKILHGTCILGDLALMVTRCPEFENQVSP